MGDAADDAFDNMMQSVDEDRIEEGVFMYPHITTRSNTYQRRPFVGKTKKAPSRTLQPRGIVSFPMIFTPQMKEREDQVTKQKTTVATYSLDLLLPKDSPDVDKLRELALETATIEWGPDLNKWPKPNYTAIERAGVASIYGPDESNWPLFKFPAIRDQGEKEVDQQGQKRSGYVPGCMFISPTSKFQPPVVDYPDCKPIADPAVFYGGCEVLVEVNAYTYNYMGNVGVKFGLIAVQKVGAGTPFGVGRPDPTKIFSKPPPAPGVAAGGATKRML